jgi:hypothetical protein
MLSILGHKGNANQNSIEIPPHACQKWLSSITQTTNDSKDVGKNKHFHIVVGL